MESFNTSFSSIDDIPEYTSYLGNASEADWVYSGYIDTYDDALLVQMPNNTAGTVVSSTKYFWYGKISVTMKSSRGAGVITAFITFSDVKDEIDYEFRGYNLTDPQSNFYSHGLLNYTNFRDEESTDTYENWHTYEIDWAEDKLDWILDGKVVRTLLKNDTYNATADVYHYPQTPSRIQLSLWPGGAKNQGAGTIEWAGGEIDWNSQDIKDYGYYYALFKDLNVETYDLPAFVQQSVNSTDDYHAFRYNSTDGWDHNVKLTKDKTYLGNDDASGLDPQNNVTSSSSKADTQTSKVVILSGSLLITSTSVQTLPNGKATSTGTSSASDYTGGFQQGSGSSAASSSTGNLAGSKVSAFESLVAVAAAAVGGLFAFAF